MSKNSNQLGRNTLNELFNSKTRVRALRFLFRNYPDDFNAKELAKMIQEREETIKKEIKIFLKIGLVKKK